MDAGKRRVLIAISIPLIMVGIDGTILNVALPTLQRELGATQDEVMRFTENVGLALAQQGGSAESAAGALQQVDDAQGLAGAVQRLVELPQDARRMGEAGRAVMRANQGALQRLLAGLERLMP